jgi:RNA-directed DNA polymerase
MLIKKSSKEYRQELELLNEESEVREKLRKLYTLNKNDSERINDNQIKIIGDEDLLMSSYEKLKKNKRSTTPGTTLETPDEFNLSKVRLFNEQILKGQFKWTDVKRIFILKPGKKKKRSLRIPSFTDKLAQENVKIVLNVIYEPIFQRKELHHGFRPRRIPETAIIKLQRESKETLFAIKGGIKGSFYCVDRQILLNILKKKIVDKKLLLLIESGLKHNITFEGTTPKNLIETPQGKIASPLLFNIYMHESDEFVQILFKEYSKINLIENRQTSGKLTRYAQKMSSRIVEAHKRIGKYKSEEMTSELRTKIHGDLAIMRKSKSLLLNSPSLKRNSLLRGFAYSRYADDLIILTNAKQQVVIELKNELTEWLKNKLHFTLDQEKTLVTDLEKKAKYLGFCLFRKKKRIICRIGRNGTLLRQRLTALLTVGIDHERVRNRLIAGKLLNPDITSRSNPIYMLMRPIPMITKYKQKLNGLCNYYYRLLTYPTELNQ